MRVGVEEPVPEDHRHPGLGHHVREPAALLGRPVLVVEVGELDALKPVEGQHPVARVAPVRARHPYVRVADEVPVKLLRVPRLVPVVELLANRARELVDERNGVDELERADALPDEARGLVEELEVGLDLARSGRPLHLDHHALAVRKGRAVHLADRGRRERLLLEVEEELLDRETEVLLDDRPDLCERERMDVVLQRLQLEDDVGRHHVRPRREKLPELDEGRPELVEHLAEPLTARRALPHGRHLALAARDDVAEAMGLEEVAEAVPRRDLCDLGKAAELADGRPGAHGGESMVLARRNRRAEAELCSSRPSAARAGTSLRRAGVCAPPGRAEARALPTRGG